MDAIAVEVAWPAGATPDSDRAKKPPLSEPSATDQELNPADRVEGLGDFGKPTGESEFFTIEGNKIKEVEVYFGSAPKDASNR